LRGALPACRDSRSLVRIEITSLQPPLATTPDRCLADVATACETGMHRPW